MKNYYIDGHKQLTVDIIHRLSEKFTVTHLDAKKKISPVEYRYYPFGISCKLCEIEGNHSDVGKAAD